MKWSPSLRAFLLLPFLLTGSSLLQADELQDILGVLSAHALVRADFSQDKTLPALKKPLHSEGQLVFAGRDGVLLRLRQPVAAELVITPDVLLQKTARTQTRLRLDQSPYGAVAGIFGQLMNGDADKLKASFTVVAAEKKEKSWNLRLQPRDPRLLKLFSSLNLRGDDFLRELQISENGGGETRMTLRNHQIQPARLNDDEQKLFALAH